MRVISPCSASILSALLIETSSRSGLAGLTTKSTAPARIALIAVSIEPWAVCTMIGGMPGFGRARSSTAMPSVPGMTRSSSTRRDRWPSGPSRICEGLIAALGDPGLVAEPLDHFFEDATLGGIVIDDEDALDHGALQLY